jgi:CRISPR-associated protein Cas1
MATTLYLTEPGTTVRYRNQTLVIKRQQRARTCRLAEIDLVVILPGVQCSDVVLAELMELGIETIFLRRDGRFRGRLQGRFPTNPAIRLAQYRVVDTMFGMALAQKLVEGKIRNQRTVLQRQNRTLRGRIDELSEAVDVMASYLLRLRAAAATPVDRAELMGIEGICARTYYQALRHYFPALWSFTGRNRRPPKDPINALLSWGYGVLLARVFSACVQAGLDPYLGFFHATEPYRPNLVLDLMEEFRPIVVDWAVIALIRNNAVHPQDFEPAPQEEGVWLGQAVKKQLLQKLEERFQSTFIYPPQQRQLRLSQIIVEQGRWLGRCLVETNLEYEAFAIK